jgi:hypothetical protein
MINTKRILSVYDSHVCFPDRLEGDRSEGSGQENENEDEE